MHEAITDFARHIWDRHQYTGALPNSVLDLAALHAHMHTAGMEHK